MTIKQLTPYKCPTCKIALHKAPAKDNPYELECSKCGEKFPF